MKGHTLKTKNNSGSMAASALIIGLAGLALAFVFILLAGLLTWLILPLIFPTLGLGFWQCVLLAFLVRVLASNYSMSTTYSNSKE